MDVFGSPPFAEHEWVSFFHDRASGLRAIIAVHDTTFGPAIGGCRMWPYASESEALTDVLRLAQGMTYKAALADLPFGGGKSVIIGDSRTAKTEPLLRAFGRAVDSLGGAYYAAEDVGTSPLDMDVAAEETRYLLGRSQASGDPSPATAHGVWLGIRAAVRHWLGQDDLVGVRIAIQGLGHVGLHLARSLAESGAELIVADPDRLRTERVAAELGARVVDARHILEVEAEVLAPCALGAVIDDHTVPRLACRIVAGAANNQLLEPRHGTLLHERGILYAPDYVINAGGVINIAQELRPGGYQRGRAFDQVASIEVVLAEIFARAEREGRATHEIADQIAEERLAAGRASHHRAVTRRRALQSVGGGAAALG